MNEFKIIARRETGGDGTPILIEYRDQYFLQIEGFEGYFIGDEGDVLTSRRGDFRVMRATKAQKYLKVTLQGADGPKQKHIHRLVAEAFIPNPKGYKWVRHIDENPHHNWVSNLMWAEPKTILNSGTRNERIGKANKGRKHSDETKALISQRVRESKIK